MTTTTYDITSTVVENPAPFTPGETQYEATGNILDAITTSGWEENLELDEALLRVSPTTPFNLTSIGRLSFVPPNLHGLPPGRVRVEFSFDLYCSGLIRDNVAVPWDASYYLHYNMYTSNTFGGVEDYSVNGGFYSLTSIGTSGLVTELENTGYDPISNPEEPYQYVSRETPPFSAPGISLEYLTSYYGVAYYYGNSPASDPEQLFVDRDHQYINMQFGLTTGKQNATLPPLEFGWRVSNLTVRLVVETDDEYPYVPISGECGVVEQVYYMPTGVSETHEPWSVDWTAEQLDGSVRWTADVTAHENLPHDTFVVLGGSVSGDGGFGGSPPPSDVSDRSYALDPQISDVSGVILSTPVSQPDNSAVSVSVAGSDTFAAGARFKFSFTVPVEFDTQLAFGVFGTLAELPDQFNMAFTIQSDDALNVVWTGYCEHQEFRITWLEPGTKIYERGVDRGVLYMDDGRVVPWNGLTGVDEDLGRSSDSVYFDGSKLSEVVNPDGFSANVKAISYPKQLEEVYGNRPLRKGFYLGGQTPKTFGFTYRTRLGTDLVEDAGYKLHIIYNILAVPEGRTFQTISDEPNVTEFGWNFKTTPETLSGYRASAYLVIDSTRVTPSLLVEIENILYGTPTTPPRLPPLQEFLEIINDFNNFINIVDNGDGTWEANTLADGVINDLGDGVYEIQHANIQWASSTSYLISPTPDPP